MSEDVHRYLLNYFHFSVDSELFVFLWGSLGVLFGYPFLGSLHITYHVVYASILQRYFNFFDAKHVQAPSV